MRFGELDIQNFMSFRSVNFNLSNKGLVLIQGSNTDEQTSFESNGSGKTNLFEALVWVLYGKTMKAVKRSDDIVNLKAKKNCCVSVCIEDDDGVNYKITRYRKHHTHGNNVRIIRNDSEITLKSDGDTNEFITKLLQMDYLTFVSSVVYSASSFKFTTSTDKEMKQAFDTMLNLDIFNTFQERAKSKVNEVSVNLLSVMSDKNTAQSKITMLQEQLEAAKTQKYEHKKSVEHDVKELKKQLESVEITLKEHIENGESFDEDIEKYEMLLEITKTKIESYDSIQNEYNDLRVERKEYTYTVDNTNKELMKLNKELSVIDGKLDKSDKLIGTLCTQCGNKITKDNLSATIKELQLKKNDLIDEISRLESQVIEYNEKIDNVSNLLEDMDKKLKGKQKIKSQESDLRDILSEIKSDKASHDKLRKQYESNINNLKESIEYKIKITDAMYDQRINECETKIQCLQKDIEEYESKTVEYLALKSKYEFWVEGFGNQGIKSLLLDNVTPFLNKQANNYLQKLTSGTIEVLFDTQTTLADKVTKREKFSVNVSNTKGGATYDLNSGGERKRVDIAINLTLQDLLASRSNKKIDLCVFDEVFDALDALGQEKTVELLQEVSKSKSSVFVITHSDYLKSYFDNTITISKKAGLSTIIEG